MSVKLLVVLCAVCILDTCHSKGITWTIGEKDIPVCVGTLAIFPWNYTIESGGPEVLAIYWSKDGKNIADGGETTSLTQKPGYEHRLTRTSVTKGFVEIKLENVTKADEGVYSVVLSVDPHDRSWELNQSAKLTVTDSPVKKSTVFNITLHNVTGKGDNCQKKLRCGTLRSLGNPQVTFEWKRDGQIVEGSIDPKGNYSYLSLCAGNNTGNFTCQLRGKALDCLPEKSDLKNLCDYYISPAGGENANTGAIVGGVLGAVALAVVAGVAVYCWRKKTKTKPEGTKDEKEDFVQQSAGVVPKW